MAASDRALHGTTSMPLVRNEPLEMAAPSSFAVVGGVGERVHVLQRPAGLVQQRARAPPADDQVRLDAGLPQQLQHPDAEERSGGAGDGDDEACGLGQGGQLLY